MTIETKFSLGDVVWFICNDRIEQRNVIGISINWGNVINYTHNENIAANFHSEPIMYTLSHIEDDAGLNMLTKTAGQIKIFTTKAELLKSL